MKRERQTGVSPENLPKHAIEIFASVSGTRYNVDGACIPYTLAVIERVKPQIRFRRQMQESIPAPQPVAAEPTTAAVMAVSAAAEVGPVEGQTVDPGDYLAVGELAHTAHSPNASEDQSMAARVLAAWRRDGPKHQKAIDPRDLQHAPVAEAPTIAQEQQYVSGLNAAVQAPSHLPAFYDNVARYPSQTEQIQSAQDNVVQAFPMPADRISASLQPTYGEDLREVA